MTIPLKLTPMMKQYVEIKSQYEDCILFYRLGDFYEMFFEDAVVASGILKITLTSRSKNEADKVPMCGIPFHSSLKYIEKLLQAGKKVAICEQVTDPKDSKGIVERKVVQVVTPALSLQMQALDHQNYLASITFQKQHGLTHFVLSYLDLATGSFRLTQLHSDQALYNELARVSPSELLWPARLKDHSVLKGLRKLFPNVLINLLPQNAFNFSDLHGSQLIRTLPADCRFSAAAIFYYLNATHYTDYAHIEKVDHYEVSHTMHLDASTVRNLELVETTYDRHYEGSLLWLLDRTATFMGKRLLRQWLLYPQLDLGEIQKRQQAIGELFESPSLLNEIISSLKNISDLERILSRLTLSNGNARDMVALKEALSLVPKLNGLLGGFKTVALRKKLQAFEKLHGLLSQAVVKTPPMTLKDGGMIQPGFHKELDELIALMTDGKSFVAKLEAEQRAKTGISSLKVKFNSVFGYFIEVTKMHAAKVPAEYIRKQTMVNAERFITPELKEVETKILNAEEKRKKVEFEIFEDIRKRVLSELSDLLKLSFRISQIDVFCSLAKVALENHYICPELTHKRAISIKAGRHPVIEKTSLERFVPNDIELSDNQFFLIITGPNMAGKSTVMRQVALISLMAQMGSFVPASSANLSLVDGIFTRVGAHDNLSQGESTFMVEMKETAHILKTATSKSLVILDEIGRGTSTFDGLSIAWAVAADIHDRIQAKTLFATHYHELVGFSDQKVGMENFHIAVKKSADEIVFLRKLLKGSIKQSFGVEVAKLAGLPDSVIQQARDVLLRLESKPHTAYRRPPQPKKDQIGLFSNV